MITVVIPTLNEAATIASVVARARKSPAVSEILVVDDGSTDDTAEFARAAGANVVLSSLLGKGASMEDGVREAQNECVVFLDGDLQGLAADVVQRLARPVLEDAADFVKGSFSRRSGRVTELVAKPLLRIFLPEIARFAQPLGGLIAARRSVLSQLVFETDYGVDVGLLIDAVMGHHRVVEVGIGHVEHDSQPVEVLGDMAGQVARTIFLRAARNGRFGIAAVHEVEEVERSLRAELETLSAKVHDGERLALIDMDGTLVEDRFATELARETGKEAELRPLLDSALPVHLRAERIAALWRGVRGETFQRVARRIPLVEGAAQTVVALRRSGYRVIVVSDSYQIAAEIVRRRVFADAAVAYLLRFENEECTGELIVPMALRDRDGKVDSAQAKRHVAEALLTRLNLDPARALAIGDGLNDIPMFEAVGRAIAFRPMHPRVARAAHVTVEGALTGVLAVLQSA